MLFWRICGRLERFSALLREIGMHRKPIEERHEANKECHSKKREKRHGIGGLPCLTVS
jgi:hypothetical protein